MGRCGGLEVEGVWEVGVVQFWGCQNADFLHLTNSSKNEAGLGVWGGLEVRVVWRLGWFGGWGVFGRLAWSSLVRCEMPTFRTGQIHRIIRLVRRGRDGRGVSMGHGPARGNLALAAPAPA